MNSGDGNVLYLTDITSSDTFKETFLKLREEVVHVSQYPMPAVLQETYLENINKIGFHVENMGTSPVLHGECDVLINLKTIEGTHFLEMIAPVAVNSNITENFLHSFQFIFSQILKDPQIKIEDIQSLDESRKKVVLEDFNLAPEGHELKDTIVDIFEKNAEFFSDQIALQYKDKTWSYAELNSKVNQLSHAVQSFVPLKKEDRVVIITERTDVFLQTVLAVWKCNCCYIPVDPIYPDDRIKEIIEDSDPSLIIIEDSVSQREKLKTVLEKYRTFSIDEWKEKVTQYPASNPPKVTHNDNLAYIIYTSGSTGKPKGVVIEHIGMLNHIYEKIGVLDINSSSIVAQNASQGFDISVWQMFSALVKGGKTVIYDDQVVYNVVDFIQQLAKDHVSVLELVPSYFLEILNVLEAKQATGTLNAIEHLVLNAETLKHDLVKRWFALYPGKPISNTYGATEVSDDICHYVMTDIPDSITVPVKGKMFANIKMYVLDDDMHPVPVGVTGNIYIAGFPVGRGYFNNPQKTSEAFLYNPFNTQKEKLYKTGDMGRYLSCGSMEFLGRKDYQVKVRGHRVELEK